MSPQDLPSDECAPSAASPDRITLSKWVNERFPPWEQLLSAHDVARLTRRPRWVLLGLMLLVQPPKVSWGLTLNLILLALLASAATAFSLGCACARIGVAANRKNAKHALAHLMRAATLSRAKT